MSVWEDIPHSSDRLTCRSQGNYSLQHILLYRLFYSACDYEQRVVSKLTGNYQSRSKSHQWLQIKRAVRSFSHSALCRPLLTIRNSADYNELPVKPYLCCCIQYELDCSAGLQNKAGGGLRVKIFFYSPLIPCLFLSIFFDRLTNN